MAIRGFIAFAPDFNLTRLFPLRFKNRLFVLLPEEDWASVTRDLKPHIFVDELAAIQSHQRNFLKDLLHLGTML
jgi:hypothetical protein